MITDVQIVHECRNRREQDAIHIADLREACQKLINLFDAWKSGVFTRIGVAWEHEPPPIMFARSVLKRNDEHVPSIQEKP